MSKSWKITYWISTVLFSLFMAGGAVPDILQVEGALQLMIQLQYPAYLLLIVGWAKILGVAGILQTKWPTLREWAYAGLFIDLAGAFISHMFVGDGPQIYSASLIGLALMSVSYVSYRKTYAKRRAA